MFYIEVFGHDVKIKVDNKLGAYIAVPSSMEGLHGLCGNNNGNSSGEYIPYCPEYWDTIHLIILNLKFELSYST